MFRTKRQLLILIGGILLGVLVVNFSLGYYLQERSEGVRIRKTFSINKTQSESKDFFSYKGVNGKNALSILQEKTDIEQNRSGLVIGIGSRKTNEMKKEFWAFYVNGIMASVGPKEYATKDTDKIEWKIENY